MKRSLHYGDHHHGKQVYNCGSNGTEVKSTTLLRVYAKVSVMNRINLVVCKCIYE